MSCSISNKLLEKSIECVVSSIELYNKPNILYREELFSITIINAYELLFKAIILSVNNNKLNSIYAYEKNTLKTGEKGKRYIISKNRSGFTKTLSLNACMDILRKKINLPIEIFNNINCLIEIRDNAIHFINKTTELEEKLFELCAASIKNYITLIEHFFNTNILNKYNFNIMPLNFKPNNINTNLNTKQDIQSFIEYLNLSSINSENDNYYTLLKIDTRFIKSSNDDALLLKYAAEGKKVNIQLDDEMFFKMYPYTHKRITELIKCKNPDLKLDKLYNIVKKELQQNEVCCKPRYLDPNTKSNGQFWYNPNFADKIIEQYLRRK